MKRKIANGDYKHPRELKEWKQVPKKGASTSCGAWTHEFEFWGGDLKSLQKSFSYLADLGIETLYLNPIHHAVTNHHYDPVDLGQISPEYGTEKDLKALAEKCHSHGMKLVLDGVFDHVGENHLMFQAAMSNSKSQYRNWFSWSQDGSPICWCNLRHLPQLRLEDVGVKKHIMSTITNFLCLGIDGWRIDAASDIGFQFLSEITQLCHVVKPMSLVVGDIWNYPERWSSAVLDSVINFTLREIIIAMVTEKMSGRVAGRNIERMINDTGLDAILKSWIVLDNHNTPRIADLLPFAWQQGCARILQFVLPGAPCIYYGSELGMKGKGDPENRAPMRWDMVKNNDTLQLYRVLIHVHKTSPALRYGFFRLLETERLLAFTRTTNIVSETAVIVGNFTSQEVNELVMVRESKLMNNMWLKDCFSEVKLQMRAGFLLAKVPPKTVYVLFPEMPDSANGYSPYKRVQ